MPTRAAKNKSHVRVGSCVDGTHGSRDFCFLLAVGCKSCVRPVCAVLMTAGPDVIRRSGPYQNLALDSASALSCPTVRFVVDPEFERRDIAKSTTSHDKPIDSRLGSVRANKNGPPPPEMPSTG